MFAVMYPSGEETVLHFEIYHTEVNYANWQATVCTTGLHC